MRVINEITFKAKDDAEALRLAAERLGRDAVLLSKRIVKEGGILGLFRKPILEVRAGILVDDEAPKKEKKESAKSSRSDEDTRRENLIAFQKLMEFKERTAMGKAPAPTPVGEEGYRTKSSAEGDTLRVSPEGLRSAYGLPGARPAPPSQPANPPVNQPAAPSAQPPAEETKRLQNQVGALTQRVDSLLERLSVVESVHKPAPTPEPEARPKRAEPAPKPGAEGFKAGLGGPEISWASGEREAEERLRSSEVDEKYIRKLLADYGATDKKLPFTRWLGSQIRCAAEDPTGGRKVMLLGPTGVGKTTTIAKLAAIKALWEHQNVALLTSDTFRIAAVEQLRTYAKILGVPIDVVFEAESLPELLEAHEDAQIILLDTAGRAQRDRKSLELYEALYSAFVPDAVHLVLAANMKYRDMLDVIEHIPNVPISHLIFTKLDETVSYGAIFNIQQVMGCPVSFLTAGQNVPKDIETASGGRIAEFLMMTEEERKRG